MKIRLKNVKFLLAALKNASKFWIAINTKKDSGDRCC